MRTIDSRIVGTLALLSLGCSGSSGPVTPAAPAEPSALPAPVQSVSAALGAAMHHDGQGQAALAIYTLEVDPTTLTATTSLKETRRAQANDDLYMLSIDSFLNAGSFKVTNVSATADTIDLGYLITHPFPAPSDPTGTPNGSTNRADLGIAGMVLFLADVPSAAGNTYFTDRIANTGLIANADAYYSPEGLITSTATANLFPYKELVDESADPREGVSNGGDVTGNFGSDGWTRGEFGPGNNGWTGYGVLHQGQAAVNTVSFDKDALSVGFSLDVAIIAKYNDPRGGSTPAQKKANRLPPATADASLFAYRMPHGALDVSSIQVPDEAPGFIANTISAAMVSVQVVDYDLRGTTTTAADLSEDPSFTTVAVGEAGAPLVEICIPGVLGDATNTAIVGSVIDDDTAYGGDLAQDSGADGDPVLFQELVTKTAGTGQTAGDFTGMVRVTDPEVGLLIGLDGNLTPLATPPDPITYQVFTVTQLPDNAPPSAVVTLTSGDPLLSGTPASVAITSIADADSDPLDISVDWGNGGGFVPVVTGLPSPYANQTPSSPNMNNADLVVDTIDVVVRLSDGSVDVDIPLSYQLGANRPPQVTGNRVLASTPLTPPASFTMNAGTGTATDPEGDAVSYTITNSRNSDQVAAAGFPNAANTTPIATIGAVTFMVYANDPLHPTTSGTAYPVVNGGVFPVGPFGWAFQGVTQGTGSQTVYDIAVDQTTGHVYFVGTFGTGVNFGDGATTAALDWLVKLDQYGQFVWKRQVLATTTPTNTAKSENITNVVVRPSGNVVIMGEFDGEITFGGPTFSSDITGGTTASEWYLAEFTSANAYVNSFASTGPGDCPINTTPGGEAMALDSSGNIAVAGSFDWQMTVGSFTLTNPQGATDITEKPFVVKVNSALVPVWAYTVAAAPDASTELFNAVCFDPAGNVYAGGDGEQNIDFGGGPRNPPNDPLDSAASVVKLNGATGAWMWDRMFQGTASSTFDDTWALATNSTRLFTTGQYTNGVNFGGGPLAMSGTGSGHAMAALDFNGNHVWSWSVLGNTSSDECSALVANDSFVYLGGEFFGVVDFGFGAATSAGTSSDPFVMKFNAATGAPVWADTWSISTTVDVASSLALDSNGDLYAGIEWEDVAVDWDPGAGVNLLTPSGTAQNFIINHWLHNTNSY